jgi:lipopolysaccharide export system permease protein
MSKLSTYVLKQLIGPVALFAFLMTGVVWLEQALGYLDYIINRGQSATTFVYLTMLLIPTLLVIILPLAFFFGSLYALSRLQSDSELVVMASVGFSRWQMATPVLIGATLVMALTYACDLYLMPAGQLALNAMRADIQANIGSTVLNEGTFNTQVKGLTVFIREIDNQGGLHGALVHDNRNLKAPVTYLAESGQVVQTPAGNRLVMQNGTIQWARKQGARLDSMKFERYVFDLDQFVSKTAQTSTNTNERFLPQLLSPPADMKPKLRKAFIAEGHNRLTAPLYAFPFALIALLAVIRGRRARGAHVLRMTAACVVAVVLRISGYGVQGLASSNNSLIFLFYVLPLLGTLVPIYLLHGLHPKPQEGVPGSEAIA